MSTWVWKLSPFRFYLLENTKYKMQNKYKLRKSYKSRSRRYCPLEFENWVHSGFDCWQKQVVWILLVSLFFFPALTDRLNTASKYLILAVKWVFSLQIQIQIQIKIEIKIKIFLNTQRKFNWHTEVCKNIYILYRL